MNSVMFKCPITGKAVDTKLSEAEYAGMDDYSALRHAFTCSACGLTHHCYRGEAWLERRNPEG